MAPQYKFYYFNTKGGGEPIRQIFAYAKVPFEDVRVEKEDWPKLKESMPWGQMPVLEVDGVKIAQTNTIARFLAKKYNIAGETDVEQAKCDEYLDVWADISNEFRKHALETDAGKKAELLKTIKDDVLPKYFTRFEAIVTKNGNGLLVGKKLTYADIYTACMVDLIAGMEGGAMIMGKFPAMQKHYEMVNSQPGIKEWIANRPA